MITMNEQKVSEVLIRRGQIHMVDFGEVDAMSGSIQRGKRPAIIISNNKACKYSPVISVVPLSTQKTKRNLPTHYQLTCDEYNRLRKDSTVLAEQILTVNRFQIERQTGRLSDKDMEAVDARIRISMGLDVAI